MACSVIQALGDRFDFMVWYSDFRVDDQEAGTRSVGEIGQKVSGIGPRMDVGMRLQDYCSQGRLQVTWFQPVWVGSVQAQEQHPDGRFAGYNMAVAQIGHELGHRWSTRTRAIVNGETIELRGPHDPGGLSGATHWPNVVSTPVPFPFSRPVEASIMGGANWKDNGDGTFTQLASWHDEPRVGLLLSRALSHGLPAGIQGAGLHRPEESTERRPHTRRPSHRQGRQGDDHDPGRHRAQRPARAVVREFTEGVQHRDRRGDAPRPSPERCDAHPARRHRGGVEGLLEQDHWRRVDDVDEHRAVTHRSKVPLLISLVLVALVVVLYAPVRHYDFVAFDDYDFVVDNPHVAAGLTADGVRWSFAHAYDAAGGPLTWLSHMLDVELFGMTPGPHHLQSVILHAVNTVLLLLVLWQMTGSTWRSAFVAALFALHPMHVESVAWVSERKDVLSAMFWLLAMWAYVRYVRQPSAPRYLVVAFALTLGLLAKPMVATLPLVLLLLDVWPLKRVPLSWAGRAQWRSAIVEKLPLIALAAGFLIWTLVAQRAIGAVVTLAALPFSARLANAAMSLVTYIEKLAWPSGLAVFYPFSRDLPLWLPLVSAGILVAISVLVWRFATRRPYLAVGWLWYLVTLIPVLGFVQVGSHAMADRFTYLPAIGLFVIAAWGGTELLSAIRVRGVAPAVGVIVVIAFAIGARAQIGYWRSSETLWARALAVTNGNFRAHAGMAEVRSQQHRIDEAIAHYSEAVRLAPDEAEWHVNLGLLFAQTG